MKTYENQAEVDAIQNQLQTIDPELKIGTYCAYRDKVVGVKIKILLKGHAKVIRQLEALGWKRLYREKLRTDLNPYVRTQYSGYAMVQIMELELGEKTK